MSLKLPRFVRGIPLVEQAGTPTITFHQWWDTMAKQIEESVGNIQLALAAAGVALDNIGVFPSFSVRQISATSTVLDDDYLVLVDATSGAVTATLPTAAVKEGSQVIVKKIDASVNAVTVEGNGAETIDGALNVSLPAQYDSVTLASDGTQWWVV